MDTTALSVSHVSSDSTSTNPNFGSYQTETLTSATTTITQGGTFQLTIRQPYNFHFNGVPSTQSQAGSVAYPNYSPTYAYQQHPPMSLVTTDKFASLSLFRSSKSRYF